MTMQQTAVPGAEQTDAEQQEQGSPVAMPSSDAVAAAEHGAVGEVDLSTPEGIRAAAERYPAFKAVFADYENTGKQKTLAEIRRDQGSAEKASQTVRWVAEQIAQGANPDDLAKQVSPHVMANYDAARMELFVSMYEHAKEIDPDAVAPLEALRNAPDLSPDAMQRIAQAAIDATNNVGKKNGRAELLATEDLDVIPKDSPLWRAIDARLTHEREAETMAEQITANQKPNPPAVPSGGQVASSGRTPQDIANMTDKQMDDFAASLSEEDFNKVMVDMLQAAKAGQ